MTAYKHVLDEVLKPAAVVILGGSSAKADYVKYGVHQVTAASQEAGDQDTRLLSLDLFPGGLRILPVLVG